MVSNNRIIAIPPSTTWGSRSTTSKHAQPLGGGGGGRRGSSYILCNAQPFEIMIRMPPVPAVSYQVIRTGVRMLSTQAAVQLRPDINKNDSKKLRLGLHRKIRNSV